MAYDKNEPRTALITGISIFVIVCVVLIRYGMVSYFNTMRDQEEAVKVATRGSWQLAEVRAQSSQRLTGGAMPIDQAMAAIAQGQRPAAISPRPSTDNAAITGWSQLTQPLPAEIPQNEPPPAPPAPVVDPAALGDGGAPLAPTAAPVAAPAAAPAAAPVAAPAAAPVAAPAAHAAAAPVAAH